MNQGILAARRKRQARADQAIDLGTYFACAYHSRTGTWASLDDLRRMIAADKRATNPSLRLTRTQADTLAFIQGAVLGGGAVPGQAWIRERFGLESDGAGGYRLAALIKAGALERCGRGEYRLTEAGRTFTP